ncbi:hypothetical protein A0J48_001870 [Sphaerospermopsis aphanizomenoides BCCUSP55]|uniref:hypothetical protein n=1 Tax=Sphaerospermopsis aphanizomenoides TaxID=459663 RepID=UPI000B24A3C4|nr:hypothetical protein [Sphaerospermopsis aphanizomenoides]MBK1986310.1 hypothetical protein [Sphaerospermopsis aphanizomenoides BCCUSP55]
MLRGNTKKEVNYYPLIASLILGVLGGYSSIENIGHSEKNHSYQQLAYLSAAAKTDKVATTIDEKKAFNLVWNLPQVQRKAREIERLSRGSIRVAAVVDSSPTPDTPFYVVRVFENHPDKTTIPVYWFRVSSSSGVIEPLDLVQNQYIALEKWNPDGR